jgi:serine/threonine protein kinase/tetratricopeptide (TPR) repeat protein
MSDTSPTRALTKGVLLADRYTLIRRLGTGGAAETWLASDRVADGSVALKILVAENVSVKAFRREWQFAIRLMHAHIVRVFEFHDEALPFYSLQFIDGPDIGVLSGATPDEILPPIALVADALRYAHAKGVVHRDIKASNVLLDHNGAPYLIDFGAAAAKGMHVGGGSLIAATPQQLAGEAPQPADDIFALGGLIYELVSGRSPWGSATTEDDIRRSSPAELTTADGAAVPAALANLVARMLEGDVAARPDAASVTSELAGMGYAAAPAPSRFVAGLTSIRDEIIDSAEAVRPLQQSPGETQRATPRTTSGISPRTLGISLAVLLLILLGVVFLLPKTVERDTAQPATEAEPVESATGDERQEPDRGVPFSENIDDLRGRDQRVQDRASTERVLGELLAKMETLEGRAVQRWGGLRYTRAQAVYAEGDEAYLARDYATASEKYRDAIGIVDPMLDEVDAVFESTYTEARQALENADSVEALRLFELAVAISPGHSGARSGYARARNLDTVITLTDQGFAYEKELELDAARQSFARAIEIDPLWEPAQVGLERVLGSINQMEFDQRMTEGLTALAEGDFPGARAAFRMAQQLQPGSREPADGLLQVEQGLRLDNIVALENRAMSEVQGEQWAAASETYESILELDANLTFAKEGLDRSRRMQALHSTLEEFIGDPDSLSRASTMQSATKLLLDITRMEDIGPRLADQRDELSRLLKRAATPLTVQLVSDGITDVSIYKVGKLGSFDTHELNLRPGTYVAVGVRPGFRDVRHEFRVAPEIDMQPVVVRCEEQI